ncbi:site-specific recombinase XerC [Actinomycetospora succinea]|uniref:Site-specific recombinase XerC n=1 Tax=Actinomycetospora succinea TaxID=663603 RepID=A0A4R6VSH0_9PSEU|nr:site-specific integrase [Actinomycetospora succinea]TDQ62860.1 site-specific recombinase XerC [Actinomycetospora succinea]
MSRNQNGEGSVWPRSDGRWSGAAYVRTHTGRIERRYVYGKTEKDALAKLIKLQEKDAQGVPAGPTKYTLADFLAEWLEHMRHHVRPQTWTGYENNVRLHLVPRLGKKKLTALTVRDVRLMVDKLRAEGVSKRGVQWIHSTLRVALEHAVREELVTRNVARSVRVERPEAGTTAEPFTPDEARRFLVAVKDHRLYALWATTLMLGLRRSEACGLHWSDVDLDKGTLRIRRSLQRVQGELRELPTKTRRSTRTVPLPGFLVRVLTDHRARQAKERADAGRLRWADSDYLFASTVGGPLEPRNVSRAFDELTAAHGFRRVRLHDLRHTCVSLLLSLGVHPRVVMEIVGHSAIEMTMNVYGHITLDTQREALGRLDAQLDLDDPSED